MSHRSTTYPCFLPDLGEFSRSWSHETYPAAKIQNCSKVSWFQSFNIKKNLNSVSLTLEPWNLETLEQIIYPYSNLFS